MKIENATNENPDFNQRNEQLAKIEIGTLACIFLLGIFGNSLVLLALHAKKKEKSRKPFPKMYFFILHLSVADLINAFFNILPQLIWDITFRFKGGIILCKAVKFGQVLGPYLSTYLLMVTAVDRYKAVCHPLAYQFWSSRKPKVFVNFVWCISIFFSLPQASKRNVISWEALKVFIFTYQEISPGTCDCWATFSTPWGERIYVLWYCLSTFIVPLAELILTYVLICRTIWRSAPGTAGRRRQIISRAKMTSVKQTFAVISAYVVCSLPFVTAELWVVWDPTAYDSILSGPLLTIFALLSSLNSCVNPWIFMIFNSNLFISLVIYLKEKVLCSTDNDGISFALKEKL